MEVALKTRLEPRIRPSARVVEAELLAGRTCPCCGTTLIEVAERVGYVRKPWLMGLAIIHATRHSVCGDARGGLE